MYRIVLADDEKWALLGLSKLVDWSNYGCEIVGMASDGLSALEKCRALKPDILMTDIRMPGLDGLELARGVAMELPDTTVILITGYSDIVYAQTALRIGVFDYLTKQVTAEDLDAVLRRYLAAVNDKALKPTSQLFFSYFGEENTRSVRACMTELCVPGECRNVRAVTLLFDHPAPFSASRLLETDEGGKIVFHTGSHQLTGFCFWDEPEPDPDWLCALPGGEAAAYAGLSQSAQPEAGFYELYRQSCIAAQTARFWRMKTPASYTPTSAERLSELTQPLSQRLKQGVTLEGVMDAFWQKAEGMMLDGLEKALGQCVALLTAFHAPGCELLLEVDLSQLLSADGSSEELREMLRGFLEGRGEDASDVPLLIGQALAYIDAHFTENIRITQLSDLMHINASYFSTLIRKHTGKTYTDIVTMKRMAYAKELLRDTNKTTQEIAFLCGYHEYSHFSSLFKKKVGLSPAQYRLDSRAGQ